MEEILPLPLSVMQRDSLISMSANSTAQIITIIPAQGHGASISIGPDETFIEPACSHGIRGGGRKSDFKTHTVYLNMM